MSGYLSGLFTRRSFGTTDYMHWIVTQVKGVCDYELEHIAPPLCGSLAPLQSGMYIYYVEDMS